MRKLKLKPIKLFPITNMQIKWMMSSPKATIILQLLLQKGTIMEGEITQGVAGAQWSCKAN